MAVAVDLSIVIVNWNTRDLLAGCLAAIDRTVHSSDELLSEVVVIDNASSDDSAKMVQSQFPWVRLIESHENVGFAAANNIALELVSGTAVCLLNPDTVVQPEALTRLWQVLQAESTMGVVGAQLLNADGSLQVSTGVFPTLWSELPVVNRLLQAIHKTRGVQTPAGRIEVRPADWVSGAAFMIKRCVVDSIGPLDEDFWLYTEETDWCFRAHTAGWDIVLVPEANVYHLARASSRQRYVETMLHFYRSRVRFVYKHYGPFQAQWLRRQLLVKVAIWRRVPFGSPLHRAYSDLSEEQIRQAYLNLKYELSQPLDVYLNNRLPSAVNSPRGNMSTPSC